MNTCFKVLIHRFLAYLNNFHVNSLSNLASGSENQPHYLGEKNTSRPEILKTISVGRPTLLFFKLVSEI